MVISKVYISKLRIPINAGVQDTREFNVSIVRSVDGGKTFWYCGCGKFCRTEAEAKDYVRTSSEKFSEVIFLKNGEEARSCTVDKL